MGMLGVVALLAFLHLRSPRGVAGIRYEDSKLKAHQDQAVDPEAAITQIDDTGDACNPSGDFEDFTVSCRDGFAACSDHLRGVLKFLGRAIGLESEEQKRLRQQATREAWREFAQTLMSEQIVVTKRKNGTPPLLMEEEAWQRQHQVKVTFLGFLPLCGANGKVSLLEMQKLASTSSAAAAAGGTEDEPWVIHKSSPRRLIFEVAATKNMSLVSGFSVGFAGAIIEEDKINLMTHFEDSYELVHLQSIAPRMPETMFTLDHARYIMGSLIFTLNALRSQGIVHRDIKPENLLFPRQCLLKFVDPESSTVDEWARDGCRFILIDYGLSCGTRTGHAVICRQATHFSGTPIYSPPEVLDTTAAKVKARFGAWTHDGDTFAMGAMAVVIFANMWPPAQEFSKRWAKNDTMNMVAGTYAMLHRPEFYGEIKAALVAKLRREVVAAGLVDLILCMLNPEPSMRPTSSDLWKMQFLTSKDRKLIEDTSREIVAQRKGQLILEDSPAAVSK